MSSSDRTPVHKNWCLSLRVVKFSEGYLWLGIENVYINHTCWLYCSASYCIRINHSVHLICRSQIRQTLTNVYTMME